MKDHDHAVNVTACLLPDRTEVRTFRVLESAPLVEVMRQWASAAGHTLLPDSESPLDRLHNFIKHDEIGPAIEDMQQATGEFIKEPHTSHDFRVELVRAFRVNTRWWVAQKENMTPHEILDQVGLDYLEYTLYRGQSADPLPLGVPLLVSRGEIFEAQRDGKYGSSTCRALTY
jgi:hypothetical protein